MAAKTKNIEIQGHFTAIGMRTKVEDPTALIINTCSGNGTADRGTATQWTWANPTNTATPFTYQGITAPSTETAWQGMKVMPGQTEPDAEVTGGNWRKHKGKRPAGAYAGPGNPLLTTPGAARRAIYLPAYRAQIEHWMADPQVQDWIKQARDHDGPVLCRDFDTGRGIDRNGPVSHSWILCVYLNTGKWPD